MLLIRNIEYLFSRKQIGIETLGMESIGPPGYPLKIAELGN